MTPHSSVDSTGTSSSPPTRSGNKHCTTCGSRTEPGFRFCAECGSELTASTASPTESSGFGADLGATQTIEPLPSTMVEPSAIGSRRKRRRKSWYKRPLLIVPVVLLGMFLVAASVVAYRTMSAFDEVQAVSTPPPEISASILGEDTELVIDTGPAQQAILEQESREQRQTSSPDEDDEPNLPSQFTGLTPDDENGPAPSTTDLTPEDADGVASSNADDVEAASTAVDPPGSGSSDAGSEVALAPPARPVAESDGVNILLMGVDARDTETIDIGVRPDSLAVLNLNEETGACRVLAIPRDSRVNLPGYGDSKVNHALAVGGIPYEILVIEDYLDIEIEHYALVDFSGLVQVVDAVDGVTVDNPEAFTFGGIDFAAGEIDLDGDEALVYARYRGGSEGDFGRISRQQQVIRGLMDQVYDVNLVRVVPNMFSILSDHFRTDYGPTDLIGLGDDYRTSCTSTTIETRTIAGDVAMAFDDLMQMDLSFVISDPAIVRDDVNWLLGREE